MVIALAVALACHPSLHSFAGSAVDINGTQAPQAKDMTILQPPIDSLEGDFKFQGYLKLETDKPLRLEVIIDKYQVANAASESIDLLPSFNFQYVQDGNHLIPLQRGRIRGSHPYWEYILEPGRIWRDPKEPSVSKVTLPFTLQERNENCMHNGLMSFSMQADNTLSKVKVLVGSETCAYLKYNLSGSLEAKYQAADLPQANTVRSAFRRQREARLGTRAIADLATAYPDVDLQAFAGAGRLPKEDITLYGFIIDDVHYRGDCQTRTGDYPLCDEMSLPSYSLAKSLVAGLAAMRLEKIYPGSMQASIADYVPECRASGNWGDVSLEQALNMLTGNFDSPQHHDDEATLKTIGGFFLKNRHEDKIAFSCNAWPRRAKPGEQWVYHTTDTYLASTAMNTLLQTRRGPNADIFDDLVLPLWDAMALSPGTRVILRTDDEHAQPYSAYGLALLADDVARLAGALNRGTFAKHLDSSMFSSAMQRLSEPAGHYPANGKFYYRHGFWAYDAQSLLGCDKPVMIPFMSGYGGISVLMMPNDTVYYMFSDGGVFRLAEVLVESHRIRSMCPQSNIT